MWHPTSQTLFSILSTRSYESGIWMPVEWAAENALSKITNSPIFAPNLPLREYWLQKNRIARTIRSVTPWLSEKLFTGLQSNVFLFMMTLRKEFVPLLNDSSRKKWIYLFDSWEPNWEAIERTLRQVKNLQIVFMSSLQAAEHFQGRLPCKVKWLAQAANSSEFNPEASDWSKKENTILNIGRSNRVLDEFFERFADKHGYRYIRPLNKNDIVFEKRADFLKTLYQSKIVVVHPRNLEYPEVTGCVSTLTARYFEAYQSSGVICGFKPGSGEFGKVLKGLHFIEYEEPKSFESELLTALDRPQMWIDASRKCEGFHTWEQRLRTIEVE